MLDHLIKEQVKLAPNTENSTVLFYLPHHAVKKESRGKIKWRIGDIQQAFLQLSLDRRDRDLKMFFGTGSPKTIKASATPHMRW